MGKIVVVVSADGEWKVIHSLFPNAEYKHSPLGEWFFTQVVGEEVVFFHGGWGKVHAAASTEYIAKTWSPDLVINIGTCGGFRGSVKRNEVILVKRAVVYDFISRIGPPDEGIIKFTTDIDVSWIKHYPIQVTPATIVSGDRDLVPEDIPQLKKKYGAIVGDYESAPIAWVCARNNVKLLILRGVSDLVGPSGGEAYDGTTVIWSEAAKLIITNLVESLPAWVKLLRE